MAQNFHSNSQLTSDMSTAINRTFIQRLNKLGKVNKYIALDISKELLHLSKNNFRKWFPFVDFLSSTIDIENSCVPQNLFQNKASLEIDETAKIFFHLGVTIGNHQNRDEVLKNFRDSMGKNDLLVFTNETGTNSKWDGNVRGGCKYHVEEIYGWVKSKIGIKSEDCELIVPVTVTDETGEEIIKAEMQWAWIMKTKK
ncbi:L-histidine N(alpha)-methyltransferase [Nostoc sp. CHAB 5715]|uniref:L-histidine N(alpha)-methyltransferase n=1 Tax=Nostoc sp. CHAB 5715 TaxID=2780400 RepID=UPI001E43E1DE|nr:L-histidine N(alpha)-methyltransferase [Nostoc sp. CHAB 5715]MCC5623604.1 L-histidine N(alpha)-methyltransferase [Nostoc sp. CHAB 5715]